MLVPGFLTDTRPCDVAEVLVCPTVCPLPKRCREESRHGTQSACATQPSGCYAPTGTDPTADSREQPAWPQLQEISVVPAASSQYGLQYLLSVAAGHLQAG